MRKLMVVAVAVLLGLGTVLLSFDSKAAEEMQNSLEGKVVEISPTLVTIDHQEFLFSKKVDIAINGDTKYGEASSLKDLTEGDQIKVQYYEDEGKKVATLIERINELRSPTKGSS